MMIDRDRKIAAIIRREAEPILGKPLSSLLDQAILDRRYLLADIGRLEQELHDLRDRLRREHNDLASGNASDGYHTHNELYEYRTLYHAHAANQWHLRGGYQVTKSRFHSDGSECFGGGWFIVTAYVEGGQVSNHYPIEDWELFHVPEVERAPEWDGHDSALAAQRLREALEEL